MRGLILAGLLVAATSLRAEDAPRYEYKVMVLRLLKVTEAKQNEILNQQAAEGWMLKAVFSDETGNVNVYLERKVVPQ